MSTTVEIHETAHVRLKRARDIILQKYKMQMRMPDLMEHYVLEPEEIVDIVMKSINKSINTLDKEVRLK